MMHQSAQRRTCRLIFLVGCVLPTLAVVAWATVERLPATTAARLTAIEHLLAMRASATELTTPTPGTYRASRVELTNIETAAVVLSANVATLRVGDTAITVDLCGVALSPHELPLLADTVRRTLAVDWPGQVTLRMSDIHWQGDAPPAAEALVREATLTAVLRSIEHGATAVDRELVLQLGSGTNGPRLAALRNRQVTPPATRVTLNSAGRPVPAEWIAQLGGLIAGDDGATFAGQATITRTGSTTSGELSGTLEGISLAEATQLPVDTIASVHNLNLQWNAGRVIHAQGIVLGGPGSMSGRVARTIQPILYDPSSPQPGAQVGLDEDVEFGQLAVMFQLDGEAISFWGACPSGDPKRAPCLLDTAGNVLFGSPPYKAPLREVGAVLANGGGDRAGEVAARLPRSMQR